MLAACGTSGPVTAPALSEVIGTSLPGAIGRTEADQDKIDETVARACAGKVYTRALCDKHTEALAKR